MDYCLVRNYVVLFYRLNQKARKNKMQTLNSHICFMFNVFHHVNVENGFYLDQQRNEMVGVFGVRIRGIFPVDDVPLHQHPHTFGEHFLPNTKIIGQ